MQQAMGAFFFLGHDVKKRPYLGGAKEQAALVGLRFPRHNPDCFIENLLDGKRVSQAPCHVDENEFLVPKEIRFAPHGLFAG